MRKGLAMALTLAIVVLSQYAIWQQRSPVAVMTEDLAGNPTTRYTAVQDPLGVVVVVHGFSGNKEQMRQWGYALARQGFAAYLIDEPGHGASTVPLPPWRGTDNTALSDNLRAVIDALIKAGRAQPGRIALVGHSMGASAVLGEAAADDRVRATVAISGGISGTLPPDRPQNLLAMSAARDPASIRRAVEALGREVTVVPGRNHITVVYDRGVMDRAGAWIHKSFGTQAPAPAGPGEPWAWIWTALLGALGVMLAAGALVAPRLDSRPGPWPVRVGLLGGLATAAIAPLSAVLAGVYLRLPGLGLAVIDYVIPYFMVMAAALFALRLLWPRDFGFALGDGAEPWFVGVLRGLGVFLGFVGAVGPVIHMNLSHYMPTSPRILPMAALAIGLWPYLVQEEALKCAVRMSRGPWAATAVGAVGKSLILATWLWASALPNPPVFLALIVPVAAVLLLGMEALAHVLREWHYPPVAIATLVASVLAWSIAVSFPLL